MANVKNNAVKVEEYPLSQVDVRSIVAKEWGLHPDRVPTTPKEVSQDATAHLLVCFVTCIQFLAQIPRSDSRYDQFRIEWVIKVSGPHFFGLGSHGLISYFETRALRLCFFRP
jgi:hypothetical protein